MSASSAPTALAGIRVVDLATPRTELAGRVLADLGAEVLKLEPPGGATARHLPPFANAIAIDDAFGSANAEESLYWAAVARGKQSLVLDVHDLSQHEQLHALLANADILIESFDPGVMTQLGLGYAQLAQRYPQLIYVSVTPFGQSGPKATAPATDLTLEAAGGLVGMQGDGDRPPLPIGYPQASFHAGAQAAADALIALYARRSSGLGQYLDVSMQACVVWTLMNATGYPPMLGSDPPGYGAERANPPAAPVRLPRVVACADGYVVIGIHVPGVGERTLGQLVSRARAAGNDDPLLVAQDWSRWITLLGAGTATADEVNAVVTSAVRWIGTMPKAALQQLAVEDGFLLAAVQCISDLFLDPQLLSRAYWVNIEGRKYPGPFAKLSATPLRVDHTAPSLGNTNGFSAPNSPRRAMAAVRGAPRPAFAGLKVADFSWVGVGPMVAKSLGDHGATVVHVESANRPDVLRQLPPFKNGEVALDRGFFMANFNTSKLGLALDMSLVEGRRVARRLIDWADVVVESFTPGTMAKFGLDYESVAEQRPDLIMLSTCMRGQTGPQRRYGGFGNQGAALAGIVNITGWPDRPPVGPWGAYTDFITPRYGIAALVAALHHRADTGEGQYVDVSQIEAGMQFIEPLLLDYEVNHREARSPGMYSLYASPHGTYRCAGVERYLAIAVETTDQWRALAKLLGNNLLLARYLDHLSGRRTVAAEIDAAITAWCADQDAFAAANLLQQSGVPAYAVLRPTDLYLDAQLNHRGFFVSNRHAVMGDLPSDGLTTRFSHHQHGPYSAAPIIGQHSETVMREILGMSGEEYVRLSAQGVFT